MITRCTSFSGRPCSRACSATMSLYFSVGGWLAATAAAVAAHERTAAKPKRTSINTSLAGLAVSRPFAARKRRPEQERLGGLAKAGGVLREGRRLAHPEADDIIE